MSIGLAAAAAIPLAIGCATLAEEEVSPLRSAAAIASEPGARPIDPGLLEKVRPLYPAIQTPPAAAHAAASGPRRTSAAKTDPATASRPRFSAVREALRAPIGADTERLIVEVRWVIPMARTLRGGGEFLLFRDAEDKTPVARLKNYSCAWDRVRLVGGRWARIEDDVDSPLVSLMEDESLEGFGDYASARMLIPLARLAAKKALRRYLEEGLSAFLDAAPIRSGQQHRLHPLPERAARIEIYPSRVEDLRVSGFRYSSPWEATVLVRVTPEDPEQEAVVLDLGAKGWAEGIEVKEVELVLQDRLDGEPADRPAPEDEVRPAGWRRDAEARGVSR